MDWTIGSLEGDALVSLNVCPSQVVKSGIAPILTLRLFMGGRLLGSWGAGLLGEDCPPPRCPGLACLFLTL